MTLINRISFCLALISILISSNSCRTKDEEPDITLEVNWFIKNNMDFAYFWNKQIPNINPNSSTEPSDYFYSLLYEYGDVDRWSFITDDYKGLVKQFAGIQKDPGLSVQWLYAPNSTYNVVGQIEFVHPNTPAEEAGMKRGQIIYKINGTILNENNFYQLYTQDQLKIELCKIDANNIIPISNTINITPSVISINPIHLDTIINYQNKKIGYLVYTSFIDEYNNNLEDIFQDFKSENIDELILDLRYNRGGSVNTAILLANMIVSQTAIGDVFIKEKYNEEVTNYLKETSNYNSNSFIKRFESNPNNLNLNKLVVLTTTSTASASEMIIYGLAPHMEIYQIGEKTHGKYYGSITIYDEEEKHNWAIQPIVMRAENKNNSINYEEGLYPNQEINDFSTPASYYTLGDIREEFLATALEYLTGSRPTDLQLKSAQTLRHLNPVPPEKSPEYNRGYDMFNNDIKIEN